jgi:hypothetical protein
MKKMFVEHLLVSKSKYCAFTRIDFIAGQQRETSLSYFLKPTEMMIEDGSTFFSTAMAISFPSEILLDPLLRQISGLIKKDVFGFLFQT